MHWHTITTEEVLKQTNSSAKGLTEQDIEERRKKYGRNELQAKKKKPALLIFLHQFIDVMILVLAAAAVISAVVGEVSDAFVIVVIIVLNAVVGFVQEYRAEKAMEALQKMATPFTHVIRDNKTAEIPSSELVPGDLVLLEAGNMVPADIRLIRAHSLKANEASLTGESNTVDKTTDPIKGKDIGPGDKTNMLFKGTVVINGRGKGVVVATGMQSELGKIAGMLQEKESQTPLQKRMADFSKKLTVIIIIICAVIFGTGYLRGEDVTRMLLTAISVAVAAIPEALPAVITISLAIGAKRLVKENVLIRKLHAVETLGSVTYICSDKTGTLTKNQMTVKTTWIPDDRHSKELIKAMSLNHDVKKKENGEKLSGDPTELAILNYAQEHEHFDESWEKQYPREDELPFDANRKAMSTIHRSDEKYRVITKGAPEVIAGKSAGDNKEKWKEQEEKMANEGMRVIAFAAKELTELPEDISPENIETDLEFLGLAGLMDPPREEAGEAIKECKTAGIRCVMITGDHPSTAAAIAKELGILEKEDLVITGAALSRMSEEEFQNQVEHIRVYARVSPEQKLNIVKALQNKNQFVAMTGDGVNDAPSLRKSNIGVAMGITGTDVTREAAHMILLDDNFATIVKAVKQGRRIYDNIRKFIRYIMTGNSAEIWTIFLAPLLGLPVPLLPVHILWINLVTDGLPALALAAEPAEKDIMKRKPRKTNESIFSGGLGIHVVWVGILMGLLSVGVQWYEISNDDKNWQTIVFTTLCFSQLWHVMAIRSETRSLFSQGLFSNKTLLGAVVLTVLVQLATIYIPQFNSFFHTSPLTWTEILTAIGISSIAFWAVEIEKMVKRYKVQPRT